LAESPGKAVTREELGQLLDNIPIFGGLSEHQTDFLLSLMRQSSHPDGAQIFAKGDMASSIYVVISGEVRLDFELPNHPLSDIRFSEGSCFGETSLIGIQSHSASTYTVGETVLLSLSGADLLGLYEDDPDLFGLLILNIAREACRRLHETDELFLQYVNR
jgi:CRP/FNR family transcriptional regulator, cyclic AMP receptor protein